MENNNFIYTKINSANIFVDKSYQRELNPNEVKKISTIFNPNLVNLVKISYRDGKYYVFDGQHTISALKSMNGNRDLLVDCKVFTGLTQQDEAALFAQQNGISRAVEVNAKFRALYVAGDKEIIELRTLVESVGIRFDFTGGPCANKITACSATYKIFKSTSKEDFLEILTIIKKSWNGEKESLSGNILNAMCLFCSTYKGKYDMNKAISKFAKESPTVIIRDGKVITSKGYAKFARQLVSAYNKNRKTGRLDEMELKN